MPNVHAVDWLSFIVVLTALTSLLVLAEVR
jgi:hypothetical protein